MKRIFTLLTLMTVMLSSESLFAQDVLRYEGQWPKGDGILYSSKDGLIFGTFSNGLAEGRCVSYLPNGEVYWGEYKKGKATGQGRIYRDNGIVFVGQFKNGKGHGVDTLYRTDGSVLVAKFKKGKLKSKVLDTKLSPAQMPAKPRYPRISLRPRQEEFLGDLEVLWQTRNLELREAAGLAHPRFNGGTIDDFALWVNSQVVYPRSFERNETSRTVLVEFTVKEDGSVHDVHAVFGSNTELNAAAVAAVSKSPKWEPAEFQGKKRSVRLTVPVVFANE